MTSKAKPRKLVAAMPYPSRFTDAQMLLMVQLAELGQRLEPEYKFHLTRKWRIDVALLDHDIAIEIDGGAWIQGRHGRGTGIEKDNEKYAALAIAGWRLIRCTPGQVKKGIVLEWVKQALAQEAA
jgi:very-short-patch-repair endonuclease